MAPTLDYNQGLFLFQCDIVESNIAKEAGFKYSTNDKIWFTPDLKVAAKLKNYASDKVKNIIARKFITVTPWLMPLPTPPNNLLLMPHQREAIEFSLSRNFSYLGLDPRLGKTICAAMIIQSLGLKTVFVTPPFLVTNLIEELRRWAPQLSIGLLGQAFSDDCDVAILKDSTVSINPDLYYEVRKFTGGKEALLIADEHHRFKTEKSNRTKAFFGNGKKPGIADLFLRRVFMSGTPMPNKPIELYPVLNHSAPQTIDYMNKFEFGVRFCGAYHNGHGWDFNGATNMGELARRVIHPYGPFMLRQRRALLSLPPKIEEVFLISGNMTPQLRSMDNDFSERYSNVEDIIKYRLAAAENTEDLHMGTYRRLLGYEKVGPAVEYVKAIMNESKESILIFAYHREVVSRLTEGLKEFRPLTINGDTNIGLRHSIVKQFQNEKERRILIGNFHAMGMGFTLSKADRVLFVEFDWVPGVNEQAADRACHLEKKDSVFVQYMVYKDSIDKLVIETLLRKRKRMEYI